MPNLMISPAPSPPRCAGCARGPVGWFWFVSHVSGSHVWWPLPRWRVGHEFRWGIRPVSLLILGFFSDIRFHIENSDGPEEEDQEDGMFRWLASCKSLGAFGSDAYIFYNFDGSVLLNILICILQKVTRWTKTNLLCTVMLLQRSLLAPSYEWSDLCWATSSLIGEFSRSLPARVYIQSSSSFLLSHSLRFSFLSFIKNTAFNQFSRRQMAARCCQDALRASKTKEEVYHVLRLMVRLSDDIGKWWSIFA